MSAGVATAATTVPLTEHRESSSRSDMDRGAFSLTPLRLQFHGVVPHQQSHNAMPKRLQDEASANAPTPAKKAKDHWKPSHDYQPLSFCSFVAERQAVQERWPFARLPTYARLMLPLVH